MNRKIKIMYIVEATSAGVGKHITDILTNIDSNKFEVHLIYSLIRSDEKFRNKINQSHNIFYHKIDMYREINFIRDFKSLVKIISCINEVKPDIIHCHSSKAGFLGRIAGAICRIPVRIYSPHAFPFNNYISKNKSFLYKSLEKFAGKLTTTIVATSKTEYEQALKYRIVNENKITLIWNGIDLEYYNYNINKQEILEKLNIYLPERTKIIGFISRMTEQKDPLTLIKALDRISSEEYIALICGDGELFNETKQLVEKLNLDNKVFMLGYMDNYIDIMKLVDIVVLPSLWEGLPYILLESMACGKLVIASNVVGNKDIIKDEKNGFLFEPKDYIQLSQILKNYIHNNNNYSQICENAKKYIFENHSITQMVRKLEKLYFEKIKIRDGENL